MSPERVIISFTTTQRVVDEADSRDKGSGEHEARRCEITMVRLETETDRA